MKITKEQFNNAQKTFYKRSLSDAQKQAMFATIYSKNGKTLNKPILSPLNSYFIFFKQKVFIAMAVIISLVSGASYASAMSMPGDLLYNVKINVIEPIGLVLQLKEESKNQYQISLLQKRIDELDNLKQKGNVRESSQKASIKATNKNVKKLERSAIFNEEGKNDDVSKKIESYNNLIDIDLKIETNIKTGDEEKEELDPELDEKIENKETEDVIDGLDLDEEKTEDSPDIKIDAEINEKIENENQNEALLPLNIEVNLDTKAKIPAL